MANVAITDFDFSKGFNAVILEKVKSGQDALKAVNKGAQILTEANAQAQSLEAEAAAEVFEIEQNSLARTEALEQESAALQENTLYLRLRAAEKWDGIAPVMADDPSRIPFLEGLFSLPVGGKK